ncbi:MAG: NmrA family NAD(P)-binding protein [Proteobacteria bacterium]|nr:NmrA family NAD(P)-binding protein [Burkholderiales bacterium]
MILITSAAGQTGTRIIRLLVARGAAVRGFVQSEASADKVRALGAQAFRGDLRDAQALGDAMRGVERLYHIAPTLSFREHEMGRGVVDAAVRAGLRHFVLHGVMAPYLQNINYHFAKELIQWDLYRSGLPYTVMLPTNYMQNVNWTWPTIVERGEWQLPYDPERRLTWVDLDDLAEAAANVLTEPDHAYGTYELCGSNSFLSRVEIARLMSNALGREVRAVKVPVEAYLDACRRMPFFSRMRTEELDQIRAMFTDYDEYGMPAGNAKVLSMLLGRPASSYAQFLQRLAEAWRKGAGAGGSALTHYGLPSLD